MQRFIEKFLEDFTTLDDILLVVILLLGLLNTVMIVLHYKPQENLKTVTDSNTPDIISVDSSNNENVQEKFSNETLNDSSKSEEISKS